MGDPVKADGHADYGLWLLPMHCGKMAAMNEKHDRRVGIERVEQAFGFVLRELRMKHEISQETLGFQTGYHRTFISLLERGVKGPSLRTVFKLAKALQVNPVEMVRLVSKRLPRASKKP